MYTAQMDSTPTPPFRHRRGGRRGGGLWQRIPLQAKILIPLGLLAMCGSFGCAYWSFFGPADTQADAPPAVVQTVPPLPASPPTYTPYPTYTPGVGGPAPLVDTTPLPATATFQAAINKPAMDVRAAPGFTGIITYESGCIVSNLGFTTAGLTGSPYYLYFRDPLDRDPLMQMVNVVGYTQKFEQCAYPVIVVSSIFWLDQQATPAPIAYGGQITGAVTNTLTAWGQTAPPKAAAQPVYKPPPTAVSIVITPTAAVPPTPVYNTDGTVQAELVALNKRLDDAMDDVYRVIVSTSTPAPPTHTPTPSPSPTTQANVSGPVISVAGCAATNLAIQTGPEQYTYLIFAGATLPTSGSPTDYHALAIGVLATACNGQAIRANTVSWYIAPDPTATPTSNPTATPTSNPTATPTSNPTATPTSNPTATPTSNPTATPTSTSTPTNTPTPTDTPTSTSTPTDTPTATLTATEVITP